MRRQAANWEKVFAKGTSDKGMSSKIYKELLKYNEKIKTWLKTGQDLNRYLIKDTKMANKYMKKKNTPHQMSSGKCKLKQKDSAIYWQEWPKSRTLKTPNAREDVEQQEVSFIAGWKAKWHSHFGRVWQFLTKLTIFLPYDPVILFLGIYPKELKTYVHTKPCIQMFVDLLLTDKALKKPRCLSVDEWINCNTSRHWNTIHP